MTGTPALNGQRRIQLSKNELLAFKARRIQITCLTGVLWLTGGVRGDCILESGQQATVHTKAKICIQAMAPSVVLIQQPVPAEQTARSLRASAVA